MSQTAGGNLSDVTAGAAGSFVAVAAASPMQTDAPTDGSHLVEQHNVAGSMEAGIVRQQLSELTERVETLSALVELLTKISDAGTFLQASQIATDAIRRWLSADVVEIAWQTRPGSDCELIARSGTSLGSAEDAHDVRLAAAEEMMTRGDLTDSLARSARERAGLLAVKEFVRIAHLNRVIGASLLQQTVSETRTASDAEFSAVGGSIMVCFARMTPEQDMAEALAKLDACRIPVAQALGRIFEREPTWWEKAIREPVAKLSGNRKKWIALATLFLLGIAAIPMPYKASVKCCLQPTQRRFVSSPIAGTLKSAMVLPGDFVEQNQSLAMIDPREIEIKLQGSRAELRRADRERKGYLAQHKIAESKLLELKVRRLEAEVSLLESRLEKLNVRTPIDGTVVTGDWKRAEGTLLEKGEMLFEVAPLGEFRIELEVDESDLLLVREKMPLAIRLDAIPSRVFYASVSNVYPRAELRNDRNVFIACATLVDPDMLLRPGMKGQGVIKSDSHPIGWNLFHKAYHRLVAIIGV